MRRRPPPRTRRWLRRPTRWRHNAPAITAPRGAHLRDRDAARRSPVGVRPERERATRGGLEVAPLRHGQDEVRGGMVRSAAGGTRITARRQAFERSPAGSANTDGWPALGRSAREGGRRAVADLAERGRR